MKDTHRKDTHDRHGISLRRITAACLIAACASTVLYARDNTYTPILPGNPETLPRIPEKISGRTPSQLLRDSLPGAWQYEESLQQTLPSGDMWWRSFEDPVLDSLINLAEERNYDILSAARRLEAARQSVRQAKAAYWPEVGVSGSWSHGRNSGLLSSRDGEAYSSGYFDLGLSMSWEIDLFGRVRSDVKAGEAALNVSRARYVASMVSLVGELARSYVQLRMYQEQLAVASAHQETQEKVVAIAKARHEAGIGNMLDVSQALTVLYSTRASVPGLEAMIETSTNALAILTGSMPGALDALLKEENPRMPRDPGVMATGVPADLLRRRPDVVEAEANMARMAALCGVAKSDFLPTLSLSASAGTSARNAGDLFSSQSLGWNVAPVLSWTIFDGMARNAASAQARMNFEASVDDYNATVLGAMQEVDNSMSNYRAALRAIALRRDVIQESRHSFDLSLDLYKQGLSPFSNVADAMMSLLSNQNSLIGSQGKLLTSYISLYEALGGGFDPAEPLSEQ